MPGDVACVLVDEGEEAIAGRCQSAQGGLDARDHGPERSRLDLEEELFLRGEVVVEARQGLARLVGEVAHRHPVEAALGDGAGGRVEDGEPLAQGVRTRFARVLHAFLHAGALRARKASMPSLPSWLSRTEVW